MIFYSSLRSSLQRRTTTSLAAGYMAYQISRPYSACQVTLMEAPTNGSFGQWSRKSAVFERNESNTNCKHRPATLFYPSDVYYNPQTKAALARIRSLKRDELPDDLSHLTDGHGGGSDDDDDNRQHQVSTKPAASDETMKILNSCGNKHSATMTLIGYKGGTLESQINQDRAIVASPFFVSDDERRKYYANMEENEKDNSTRRPATLSSSQDQVPQPITSRLLGVFDGHARLGEQVSQYTVTELPKLIATKLRSLHGSKDRTEDEEEEEDPDDVVRILKESFIEIDKTAPAEISGGCTASVILQRKSKVYVANAGDSRSFLVVYRPSKQTVEVIYISREDKPHLLEERKRVERMGGQVWLPVVGSSRVLYTDPETGIQSGLAMSRSIGDWEVGELGVIAEPIVDVLDVDDIVQAQIEKDCQIPDDDEGMDAACFFSKDDVHVLAVSASDGLMDFTTPEMVAQTLAVSLYHKDGPHILTALEQLIYVAAHGWEQTKQGRYRDDISVAVAEIRRPPIATEETAAQ